MISTAMNRVVGTLHDQDGSRALTAAAGVLQADSLALTLATGAGGGLGELLWCTDPTAQSFEDLQLTVGEGPGFETTRTEAMVWVPDLTRMPQQRWDCTPDDAFAALSHYARTHQLKLTRLARDLADGTFDFAVIPRPAG